MRNTIRTSHNSPENNFHEISEGDAPSSIELSLNSKGLVQWTIKLYYATPDEMHEHVDLDLAKIDADIKRFTSECGYTLAGQ